MWLFEETVQEVCDVERRNEEGRDEEDGGGGLYTLVRRLHFTSLHLTSLQFTSPYKGGDSHFRVASVRGNLGNEEGEMKRLESRII